ncbi:hypothetical protein [Hymenobacter sp. YC55]|uniref:hypothetical protein n=1 Tax=Hymenobacter sp. YC55 TaxID=3034019 RepID=UPI0023F76AD5|nr:hypothetical protein [Hymenobacter sp. YC55]MDF7815453.1 hypothetical protein [Hymenobacter sp. YC55]
MSTNKNPESAKPDKPSPSRAANSVRVTGDAFRQVTTHAKKLKLTNGEYVSAAIAYFAETGLDPTKERPHGLANVTAKVSQETLAVRQQNVEIGNRVISILRGWEKTLYGFLQQQQAGTLNYLQQIESNILGHQVQVESTLLAPMVEQLFKVNLEAFITRGLTSQLLVKSTNQPEGSYQRQMDTSNNGRDQQLALLMREFIKTNNVDKPKLSPKPTVPATPAKAPSQPAATTPAAGGTQK